MHKRSKRIRWLAGRELWHAPFARGVERQRSSLAGFHLVLDWSSSWTILTQEPQSAYLISGTGPPCKPVIVKAHVVPLCCGRDSACQPQCIFQYSFSARSMGFALRKRQTPTSTASAANAIALSAMFILVDPFFHLNIHLNAFIARPLSAL